MISPKKDVLAFEKASSIIFVLDKAEYSIERSYADKSPYLKDLQVQYPPDQNIKITMPKWVSNSVFGIFYDFLKHSNLSFWSEKNIQIQDQTLQRLLWLGDFFQMDNFQDRVISELIVPRLDVSNCLLFLNEAFKKLKACEESNDMWYMLLNSSMNFAAKNLIPLYRKSPHDFLKVNPKILEEIIERSLKLSKGTQVEEKSEILEILMKTRNAADIFQLLQSLRKGILGRKLNNENHSSISWKLSNLDSMINKETNTFKFNGLQWKLQAKMEEEKADAAGEPAKSLEGKVLRIYLRLESTEQEKQESIEPEPLGAKENKAAQQQHDLTSLSKITSPTKVNQDPAAAKPASTGSNMLISLYYQIFVNEKDVASNANRIKHVIVGKTQRVVICEFRAKELQALGDKKIEFKVFINCDQLYAAALSTISKNIDKYFKDSSLKFLTEDDLVAINKVSSIVGTGKGASRSFAVMNTRWVLQSPLASSMAEIFKSMTLEALSLEDLIRMTVLKKIRSDKETCKLLEEEISKKRQGWPLSPNLNVDKLGDFVPEGLQAESENLIDGAYFAQLMRSAQRENKNSQEEGTTSRSEKTLEEQQTPHRNRHMTNSYTGETASGSNDLPANKLDKLKRQTPSRSMIKSNLIDTNNAKGRHTPSAIGTIIDKENLTGGMQAAWSNAQGVKQTPLVPLGQVISKPQSLSEKDILMKEVLAEIDIRRFIKPSGVSMLRDFI